MSNENRVTTTSTLPDPLSTGPVNPLLDKPQRERKRLSRQASALLTEYLDQTYGHACIDCGTKEGLQKDHKNGDPSDNSLANFIWRCRPCNLAKRPLDRLNHSVGLVERERLDEAVSEEIARADRLEPAFRKWLFDRTQDPRTPLYSREAICSSAEVIGCSILTTRRYLEKAISPAGPYVLHSVRVGNRTLKEVIPK